jgi:ABC-type glycerol-3-phosphate transport system substrate-binding protein
VRNLIILVMALCAIGAWAEGTKEAAKLELTILNAPPGKLPAEFSYKGPLTGKESIDYLLSGFKAAYPNVTVKQMNVDLSSGSTMSMDALVASGQAPDVYFDAPMRTAKYTVPEYALALDSYVTDWADYIPSALDSVKRNGKIYAFPGWGWMVAMNLNMDLLAQAKATVPAKWTIADFEDMARKVKALGGGAYATYLFAGNQSSDQWWMPWFTAFGARYYAPGDYSRNTLNSPQAVAALKWMKSLIDNGYVRPDAASITDTEALADFKDGKIAAGAMQSGHIADAKFKYAFTEFPRMPGTAGVGVAAGTSNAVVKAGKDAKRNEMAAKLGWHFTGAEAQRFVVYQTPGAYPSRLSVTDRGIASVFDDQIKAVAARNGVLDMGISMPRFTPIRAMMFPLLQAFYSGKLSAEEVMKTYEANVNKVLAEK